MTNTTDEKSSMSTRLRVPQGPPGFTIQHGSHTVAVSYEQLTPSLAEQLLAQNIRNRKTLRGNLDKLIRALNTGDWSFNGDSIRVAHDGTLLDGQHRCLAVVETGISVPTLIIRGLPYEAQATVDIGTKRSLAGQLQIDGEPNSTALAATIKSFIIHERFGMERITMPGSYDVSNAEGRRWLRHNPWVRDVLHVAGPVVAKTPLSSGPAGVLVRQTSLLDRDDADFFWDRVISGVGLDEGSPIGLLREVFYREVGNLQARRNQRFFVAVTIKAWNFYREGESVKLLKFTRGGSSPEKFPVLR